MKKNMTILAVAALLMGGCNNGYEPQPEDSNIIRVDATLGSTRATLTEFEDGDMMGLYAVEYANEQAQPLQLIGNYINNEPLTYNGTEWQAAQTLYWSNVACDFYGIYPYMELPTLKDLLFNISTNQSEGGYEASDLMWASAKNISRENGTVHLPFQHLMSRVVVKLVKGPKYEGELPEKIDAHIYNTATTALVNLVDGNLEKYAYSAKNTITMRQVAEDTFDAIVVPQHIENNTPLVEITMEGIAYLLEYSLSFRPGYQHTITVTLNTSPDQEKIEINIDGEVDDWK